MSGMTTVAEVALAAGVQVANQPPDWDTAVTAVLDLDQARELLSLEGVLIVVAWQPHQPSGPLPDLLGLVQLLVPKNPAAILVNPARHVNPPRPVMALAQRDDVCLLWNNGDAAEIAAHVERLLHRQPPTRTVPVVAAESILDILHSADNLDQLIAKTGQALGATVRLIKFPSTESAVATLPLSGAAGTFPALEVHREAELSTNESALLDALLAVFRLHAKFADSESDDAAIEIARNLKNILGEDLVQREASLRKSRRLSLFPRHQVVCLGIEPFGVSVDMAGLHDLKATLAPVAIRFDPDSITIVNEGVLVVMINATTDFDALARALYRAVQVPLAVGASDPVDDPRSYPSTFRQSGRAVAVGRRIGAINRVTRYRDLGVLGLLYQLPEHARRSFVEETLGAVAEETPEGLDQRRVLRVLRATDCNITESARELFIHPNTLRSRIARIETVTGAFMNDPDRRLTIFTALSMFSLDNNAEGD